MMDNMSNNNSHINLNNNSNKQSEDILNDIEKELSLINGIFFDSLDKIKLYSPYISMGKEKNQGKDENLNPASKIENYEENSINIDNIIDDYSNQINEHFDKILDATKDLKNFEEFNKSEAELNNNLSQLKKKNNESIVNLENKISNVEKILKDLDTDILIKEDINKRENENIELDL